MGRWHRATVWTACDLRGAGIIFYLLSFAKGLCNLHHTNAARRAAHCHKTNTSRLAVALPAFAAVLPFLFRTAHVLMRGLQYPFAPRSQLCAGLSPAPPDGVQRPDKLQLRYEVADQTIRG